jgi:hypothetical protein
VANCLDDIAILDILADSCHHIADREDGPAEDAATRDTMEDAILNIVLIDQLLDQLPAPFRALIELLYAYRVSSGYADLWPPTAQDVGRYLGDRFYNGHSVSARTIWRWHAAVLAYWRCARIDDDTNATRAHTYLSLPVRPALLKAT